jgi:exodeoxyribonuclease-3
MRLRIATWNVNSVRLRIDHLLRFAQEQAPDVLCLQEIKCREEEFPARALAEAGFGHLRIRGQKGWHGVAIASRLPLEDAPELVICREGHARSVAARVCGVEIQNFYIPAGGDVADRSVNPKFDHKLDFLERLSGALRARNEDEALAIVGDLNVAPGEFDVWNHAFMSKVVSHTPVEVAAMAALKASLGFVDVVRESAPEPARLFSWWSYRAADFRASNRGLRLDHIWVTPGLRRRSMGAGPPSARIHDDARGWERPSDHAPVSLDLTV